MLEGDIEAYNREYVTNIANPQEGDYDIPMLQYTGTSYVEVNDDGIRGFPQFRGLLEAEYIDPMHIANVLMPTLNNTYHQLVLFQNILWSYIETIF